MRPVAKVLFAAGACAVTIAAACDDQARSHIFIARVFDTVHGCVTPSQGIDVVDGPGPNGAACPPVCVLDPAGDIAITGMCPPYPAEDMIEGLDGGFDPTCTLALAAYNCNVTCGADAGPDGGLPLTDAASCLNPNDAGVPDTARPDAADAADGATKD